MRGKKKAILNTLDALLTQSRYGDGRKYWAMLLQSSRIISRTVWVSISEREGENGKTDLLAKVYELNSLFGMGCV